LQLLDGHMQVSCFCPYLWMGQGTQRHASCLTSAHKSYSSTWMLVVMVPSRRFITPCAINRWGKH
jgi:hypothetical protein